MKIVVAGATGKAGSAIVRECLSDDRVSKVYILTRRSLADDVQKDPKVEVILHQDFTSYSDEVLDRLSGASACLWAIGGRVSTLKGDAAHARKVNVELTMAAARAMLATLVPQLAPNQKFRFIFCSGRYSEWDQKRTLYFLAESRKIKGQVEQGLCKLADENPDNFETYILRPAGLLDENSPAIKKAFIGGLGFGIETSQVAKVMVKLATEGGGERIIENEGLIKM